jgi:hypothetical protein
MHRFVKSKPGISLRLRCRPILTRRERDGIGATAAKLPRIGVGNRHGRKNGARSVVLIRQGRHFAVRAIQSGDFGVGGQQRIPCQVPRQTLVDFGQIEGVRQRMTNCGPIRPPMIFMISDRVFRRHTSDASLCSYQPPRLAGDIGVRGIELDDSLAHGCVA